MTTDEANVGIDHGGTSHVARIYRAIAPPVRSWRFWIVQAAVLTIAALHDLVLVWLRDGEDVILVPGPVTSALLFVPVLYAALNFGVKGAVGTAVLSTLTIVPHWPADSSWPSIHVWVEGGNLILLNAVAVVVGVRVERERRARRRAEDALTAAEVATARYYSLFDDHQAAVLIADADGVVSETNAAGTRLLGDDTVGRGLRDLLGQNVPALLTGMPVLPLTTTDGEQRLFAPSAQVFSPDAGSRLVQVCLADVTEQHRRQEEQRLFSARLIAVQEDERRRLAQDLHDDPLQTLLFLSRGLDDVAADPQLPVDIAAQISRHAGLATEVGCALREVIRGLRPPVLDALGLASALRQLVDEAEMRSGAPNVGLQVRGEPVRLTPEGELTAYRVVQESLSNVLRHAGAARVDVLVEFRDMLSITVSDDGRGIDKRRTSPPPQPESVRELVQGWGLVGMRERVVALGGTVEVLKRIPRGTTIQATLPISDGRRGQGA
ncbi:hypothetical protein DN585_14320 [Intrasporangium calvum]|nr:hypothetical protein DN585_14320 [Intrasporangium calvum]